MERPAAIRERFGCRDAGPDGEVQGLPIRAAQLSVRSMNFGQHWRTPGVRDVRYSLTIPLAFVAQVLRRELPAYVEDCIAFPSLDDFEAALRRRKWPEAQQLLEDPELCPLALTWIAHDCLLEWLGDRAAEVPGYVINTIDLMNRERDVVRYSGTARRAGQLVEFQDV